MAKGYSSWLMAHASLFYAIGSQFMFYKKGDNESQDDVGEPYH